MRILWHSAHPAMPTGYGNQTALILPRLRNLGHEIAISATAGTESYPSAWRDMPVFPKTPYADIGEDVVAGHAERWKADLVVTLLCTWIIRYPQVWRQLRTVHLTPVDCEPMSMADYQVIADTGGLPAAVSRFGERIMKAGGPGRVPLEPLYLPHGVDTSVFKPSAERDAMRADMDYDGKFVVGMNFMNNDRFRKNLDPSLRAFTAFRRRHPDALLAIHAIQALPEGINLLNFCRHLGILDAVRFSPQYELVAGMISPAMLADWYAACDVVVNIGNEGFGLPAVEAQACGTPVILGDWSTGPDLVGSGWLVEGQRHWNDKHQADWHDAFTMSVEDALEGAHEDARNRRGDARDNALAHDIGKVVREHWEPILGGLG